MKIEKINDNQIRCTLTKEDLASRQLKLSELAYGTEKAKRLFREMMQQANFEFGFEAEDIPLMIEAIPMNSECIVLLITKVEDPEELDTRFARFSPSNTEYDMDDEDEDEYDSDSVSAPFPPFSAARPRENAVETFSQSATKVFVFRNLSEVMNAASQTGGTDCCRSALYKDPKTGEYLLAITRLADSGETADSPSIASIESFNRVNNTLSEYGTLRKSTMSASFLAEHCEVILGENALQKLAF